MRSASQPRGQSGQGNRPRPPAIAEAALADADVRVENDGRYEQVRVTGADWGGGRAEFFELRESAVSDSRLAEAVLPRLQLVDVRVEGSDAANAQAPDATLLRAELVRCKLLGIDLGGAALQDVRFVDCDLRLSSLRYAKLRTVTFVRCDFRQATLQGCELRGCVFEGCDLEEAQFSHTAHHDTDLRGSKLRGLQGLEYLRGATIDTTQLVDLAPAMAASLGLDVTT